MSIVKDAMSPLPAAKTTLRGRLGESLTLSIENRLKKIDYSHLVAPFKNRDERDGRWRCEFWGKIVRSAILSWRDTGDAGLLKLIKGAVDGLLDTQTPDGCISTYPPELQIKDWDIWGRKYVLIGLARYYLEVEPSARVKDALARVLDHLMTQVGPAAQNIVECGCHSGLAASSLLEAVVLVYRITGEKRFLDYARWIASKGGSSTNDIFASILKGVPPRQLGNGKAYEMMSCFEGLAELFRETGIPEQREAVFAFYRAVRDQEIFITGVGGLKDRWGEFWDDGKLKQTQFDVGGLGETCVTTTWIKFCGQVLRLGGDSTVADEMERTLYNGVLGAMTPDGSWWMHRNPTPLAGASSKIPAGDQIPGYGEDCCLAQGPKAIAIAPWLAVMQDAQGPVVNLYEDAIAEAVLPGLGPVKITIEGGFPRSGKVKVSIGCKPGAKFTLKLRIPAWSQKTVLTLNGSEQACRAGGYLALEREWRDGDSVTLDFDMTVRVIHACDGSTRVALMRGPVVLAQDSRLGQIDAPIRIAGETVEAKADAPRPGFFESYTLPDGSKVCDYSSAGNEFSESNQLCVWLKTAKPK